MKSISKLCLGAALLLAAGLLPATAADASRPKQVAPAAGPETVEQKSARHEREVLTAQNKITAIAKEFPLLAAPGAREQRAKFQAALSRLERPPLPPRTPPTPAFVKEGKLVLAPYVPLPPPRRDNMAQMRLLADQVVAAHPELRDFVEQEFLWHQRMFELRDQFPDNPKVKRLVVRHLAQALSVEPPAPKAK